MSEYSHQDWKTVVLRPKKEVEVKTVAKGAAGVSTSTVSTATGKPAWKIEEQVDSDVGKPIKLVSKEDASAIVKGRVEKKLTQKELAQKLNMQQKEIADIEAGKAVENKQVLSKIKRALGLA